MSKSIKWTQWSNLSHNIPYTSTTKGVGDGEKKVASELNTIVLGQNSCFDMKITFEGIEYECDMKKLDCFTFNTGVKGRNAVRPIKNKISELINVFRNLNSPLYTEPEKELLRHFENMSPDELCVSNLQKMYNMCGILSNKRLKLMETLPTLTPFLKKMAIWLK